MKSAAARRAAPAASAPSRAASARPPRALRPLPSLPSLGARASVEHASSSAAISASRPHLAGEPVCEPVFDGVSGPFGATLQARVGGQV